MWYALVLLVVVIGGLLLGVVELGSVAALMSVLGQGLLFAFALLVVGAFIFGTARR